MQWHLCDSFLMNLIVSLDTIKHNYNTGLLLTLWILRYRFIPWGIDVVPPTCMKNSKLIRFLS